MKYKTQIIGFISLCAVFGVMFCVWQFHFKEVFAGYKEDDRMRASLEDTLTQLQENFQGYKPELLIEEWKNKVQPWRDAREERAGYFSFGDWFDIDVKPQEARILKFWYTEESNKMIYDLYAKVYERMGGYDRFPNDLRKILNVAKEEDWEGKDVTWPEVEVNLRQLSFGIKLATMFLDANVSSIKDIVAWPYRVPDTYSGMLGLKTVGLHITIPAKELVKMLEKIGQEPRYFNVDSIKISYPYIAYAVEPQLDIQFLLTQANYLQPKDPQEPTVVSSAGEANSQGDRQMATSRRRGREPEVAPGAVQRFWRWFKRVVLYMP
jgi:hypothetical protein